MHRWLLLWIALGACKPHAPRTGSEVHVDRRVELVSIAFRVAGAHEYGLASPADYVTDVDRAFAPFKYHAAIERTRELIAKGIAFDAPITLALHLDDPDTAAQLDARWKGVDVKAYVAELRALERDARVDAFFAAHAAYFTAVEDRVRAAIDAEHPADWFASFFGAPGAHFVVVPGLLEGPNNYGVRGGDGMYQVIGLGEPDARGLPVMTEDTIEVVVHEMAHSFVNPLVDAHAAELLPSAEAIFKLVAPEMERQAYPTPLIMLYESGVRAITLLYVRERKGAAAAARATHQEVRRGFVWTAELADELAAHRTDPASLAAFWRDLAKQYAAHGLPPQPFLGPVDAVFAHDVVVVTPDNDDVATRYARFIHERLFAKAPITPSGDHVLADHPQLGVVAYGSPATNAVIADVVQRAGWTIDDTGVRLAGQTWSGPGLVVIACWPRGDDPTRGVVIYAGARDADVEGINTIRAGSTDWVVARSRSGRSFEVLARGDFDAAYWSGASRKILP